MELNHLRNDYIYIFKWFLDHQMKANSNKSHLITNKQSCMNLKIENINIENRTCERLLEVHCVKKCLFSEFFWSVFSRIWTEYGEIPSVSPYSVRMQETTARKTPNTDTFHAVVKLDNTLKFNEHQDGIIKKVSH